MDKKLQQILTIDDDDDIRLVGSMVLKKQGGFDVISKASGQEGITCLEALDAKDLPDLIVLDVMMPGMDGPQTLQKIRGMEDPFIAKIPIIFMTAKCQPDEVRRLINLGAADVIPKPFDPLTLSDQVQKIWEEL